MKYVIIIVCALAIMFVLCMPPAPKYPKTVNVNLDDVILLQCGFAAESYEPPTIVNGVKFPAECGCSELKGTCHIPKEIKEEPHDPRFPEVGESKHICCGW